MELPSCLIFQICAPAKVVPLSWQNFLRLHARKSRKWGDKGQQIDVRITGKLAFHADSLPKKIRETEKKRGRNEPFVLSRLNLFLGTSFLSSFLLNSLCGKSSWLRDKKKGEIFLTRPSKSLKKGAEMQENVRPPHFTYVS